VLACSAPLKCISDVVFHLLELALALIVIHVRVVLLWKGSLAPNRDGLSPSFDPYNLKSGRTTR
jgi:hypothetical protein